MRSVPFQTKTLTHTRTNASGSGVCSGWIHLRNEWMCHDICTRSYSTFILRLPRSNVSEYSITRTWFFHHRLPRIVYTLSRVRCPAVNFSLLTHLCVLARAQITIITNVLLASDSHAIRCGWLPYGHAHPCDLFGCAAHRSCAARVSSGIIFWPLVR